MWQNLSHQKVDWQREAARLSFPSKDREVLCKDEEKLDAVLCRAV